MHLNLPLTHIPVAATTNNIGDDIQSWCAAKLWNVTQFVERDNFRKWTAEMSVPLVGWYGWDMQNFPPQARCYLVSVHFGKDTRASICSNPLAIRWLQECVQRQGFPALCRDTSTSDFLNRIGVEASFGGCITSTLEPWTGPRRGIYSIDTPFIEEAEQYLTQLMPALYHMTMEQRLRVAESQLNIFRHAKRIHTSRLHVALPCRALGTEVVFHPHQLFEADRLSGHQLLPR